MGNAESGEGVDDLTLSSLKARLRVRVRGQQQGGDDETSANSNSSSGQGDNYTRASSEDDLVKVSVPINSTLSVRCSLSL